MIIGIGSDHGGYELKEGIKEYLVGEGIQVVDFGTDSLESVDYPDFARKVAEAVLNKDGSTVPRVAITAPGKPLIL
jgi:ribose 5-phosphate isomerase B